ncbi:MAG: histidine phosphatase family protein [Magnetovibrio sp.]|nr:histidine phosphatase family protein [Magnetovibrio sp.]
MKKLLILRHGPTRWNENKCLQGLTDIPLSNTGRNVVKAWRIPTEYEDFQCMSSPLQRAFETAQLLSLKPTPTPALVEMCWGEWEGKKLADLRDQLGDKMVQNEAGGLDFCPPKGESPRDVQNRLKPWLQGLNTSTIAVAHRGVIRALYALARDWDMKQKPPDRLDKFSAHLFQIDDQGRPVVERLNIQLEGL